MLATLKEYSEQNHNQYNIAAHHRLLRLFIHPATLLWLQSAISERTSRGQKIGRYDFTGNVERLNYQKNQIFIILAVLHRSV